MLKRILVYTLFLSTLLFAEDKSDIDALLSDIEHKSDLSQKTKLANSGVSLVYTRDDIQRMQAKTLRDILKSVPPLSFSENKFGVVDPSSSALSNVLFLSSDYRVFIDNQEVLAGVFDSGLVSHGDIDLGFVDHIEIYNFTPTYEFTTEPAIIAVRLYSKKVQKDRGGSLTGSLGNYGDSQLTTHYSDYLSDDWAYFVYGSYRDDVRKKHYSHNRELSRDKRNNHIFGTFYNKNNRINFDILNQKKDIFINTSVDATPLNSYNDSKNINIGYDGNYGRLSYLFAYNYTDEYTHIRDDIATIVNAYTPISTWDLRTKGYTLTSKLQYKYQNGDNIVVSGLKYRTRKHTRVQDLLNSHYLIDEGIDKRV